MLPYTNTNTSTSIQGYSHNTAQHPAPAPITASASASASVAGPSSLALPLEKYTFYLDLRNRATTHQLRDTIIKLGGRVEVFLVEAVTHVVSETPGTRCRVRQQPLALAQGTSHKRRLNNCRSRVDAMLECVEKIPQVPTLTIVQQARNLNIPVWSLQKIKTFLTKAGALACKKINGEKILKGAFIKFEALDRKKRAIFQEFPTWPRLNLNGEHSSCPFMPFDSVKSSALSNTKNKAGGSAQPKQTGKYTSKNKLRMTRRNRRRSEEDKSTLSKQRGYCEICRLDYDCLKEHQRSLKHINFVKNSKNFLSLDKLISNTNDISQFLKGKSKLSNNNLEKRSIRNRSKSEEDIAAETNFCKPDSLCNGDSPAKYKQTNANIVKANSQMSPALSDGGHYLRSKGVTITDQDYPCSTISLKDNHKKENNVSNGVASPKIANEKYEMSTRVNGHTEEGRQSYYRKNRKPRSIRWRRPSPESAPPVPDNQTYYKVVGMSTKLRSSNSFFPKESEPVATAPKQLYNGDSNPGLVVKFRRVRRSELSVLSDEAENFMFPKKDDSDTEDELVTTSSTFRTTSSELLTSSGDLKSKVKEEVFSGDDISQDSCGSEIPTKRKTRRRTQSDRDNADLQETRTKQPKLSKSPDTSALQESFTKSMKNDKFSNNDESPDTPEKCLRWEDGSLKTSPEIESLTYTFEKVPNTESWYDAFKRQDDGRENPKSISQYLGCYLKAPILPYEMTQLPPLKPNCCILSQIKKPNFKCVPSRLYGTRGMKNRKLKLNAALSSSSSTSSSSRNPRKSPREHASTLAILGSLMRKRNRTNGSDDSKSMPSILEEDISSDANLTSKSSDTCNIVDPSKKLNELLSTVYDDIEDYDIPIELMENSVKIDKASLKPNVVDLLQSYETCDVLDKTVQEMQDDINLTNHGNKRKKGYKFKKKNKTGWPNKKKIKKESSSTIGSGSSRDPSLNREPSPDLTVRPRRGRRKTKPTRVFEPNLREKRKVLKVNQNSIISSDEDDKNTTEEEEEEYSEEENYVPSVSVKSRRWGSVENNTNSENNCSKRDKRHGDLQPVVRVQKMNEPGRSKPGGAAPQRQLRKRWNPHR